MANSLYDKARESFLKAEINMASDTIKAMGLGAGYTPNLATHQFLSDVPSGATSRITSGVTLSGKTTAAGVFDANDPTFAAVAPGNDITKVLIYDDTGTESTSRLVGLIDTATGLPATPNNTDITVQFDNGASKIFKL